MPGHPFYWADHIADTGHLSLAQYGAYILLMGHYYRTQRPLPGDLSVLQRICRSKTTRERAAIEFVLRSFFDSNTTPDGSVFRHHRIDQELAKATDLTEKRRELGKRGGLAKARNLLAPKPSHPQSQSQQSQPHKSKAGGANAPAPTRKKRSFEMPEDFQSNEDHRALACELGVDVEQVFLKFRDHHLARGSTFKDWNRAYSNWLRNEHRFNAAAIPGASAQPG
jgi:uncharacterized protein YdaU (DUF1376 family)